jgi:hypothetical protein
VRRQQGTPYESARAQVERRAACIEVDQGFEDLTRRPVIDSESPKHIAADGGVADVVPTVLEPGENGRRLLEEVFQGPAHESQRVTERVREAL